MRLHIGYIALEIKKALRLKICKALILLVGRQGFEPWTHGLRVHCSTN
jgi:hypothetical protein